MFMFMFKKNNSSHPIQLSLKCFINKESMKQTKEILLATKVSIIPVDKKPFLFFFSLK